MHEWELTDRKLTRDQNPKMRIWHCPKCSSNLVSIDKPDPNFNGPISGLTTCDYKIVRRVMNS